MPDYSIKEIALITGGADAIHEFESPGDYEVSVHIDHSPLPGDLFRRVRALVRDRRLAVFPSSLVGKDEVDIYPLLGTVRGVHEALANNQGFGGDGGLPTGLRLEEALNLPNVYAQAPHLKPPKLPDGQKVGQTLYEDPKLQVRPGAPYAAFQEYDGGPVRDGQVIAADGTLFELPKDPIERFLDALTPVIEKMAEMTAIPVTVEHKHKHKHTTATHMVEMPDPDTLPTKAGPFNAEFRRNYRESALGRNKCEVVDTDTGSVMRLLTRADRKERRVVLDLVDDELRELIIWHLREAMREGALHHVDTFITNDAVQRIADDAFRRIFGEIRNGVVVTGRDVGTAP